MNFTYEDYEKMIELLWEKGYSFCNYKETYTEKKVCVLRHDVDTDIGAALKFAQIEKKLGVKSTYFILSRSDFYNPYSKQNTDRIHKIHECGHDIGLHFDEKICKVQNELECISRISEEAICMEKMLNLPISSVSMHRPSKQTLEANYRIPGIINSYSKMFFEEFKYVSDSRRNWREDIEQIIESEQYSYLHILTHPIWYRENELETREILLDFIRNGNKERYVTLSGEFTKLEEFVSEKDI